MSLDAARYAMNTGNTGEALVEVLLDIAVTLRELKEHLELIDLRQQL